MTILIVKKIVNDFHKLRHKERKVWVLRLQNDQRNRYVRLAREYCILYTSLLCNTHGVSKISYHWLLSPVRRKPFIRLKACLLLLKALGKSVKKTQNARMDNQEKSIWKRHLRNGILFRTQCLVREVFGPDRSSNGPMDAYGYVEILCSMLKTWLLQLMYVSNTSIFGRPYCCSSQCNSTKPIIKANQT